MSTNKATLHVLGSLAQDEQDRVHTIDNLRPIQALHTDGFSAVDAICPSPLGASTGVVFGAGVALATHDSVYLSGATLKGLSDVHELSVVDGTLWIPNTGDNEAIGVAPDATVSRRQLGHGTHHLNQVFRCVAGNLWALAHHVHGRQLRRRVAGRLIKSQGDGGLLSLDGGGPLDLHLAAPHSARVVNGENWVLDSGRATIRRFSPEWADLGRIPIAGWGRGAYVSEDSSFVYVGLSPLRRRYKSVSSVPAIDNPEVHVVDVDQKCVVDKITVQGVDQINGLLFAGVDAVQAVLSTNAPEIELSNVALSARRRLA